MQLIQCQVNAGLGNQLFQACAAICYGLNFNRNVILDSSWYSIQRYRPKRLFLLGDLLPFSRVISQGASNCQLNYCRCSIIGYLSIILQKRKMWRKCFQLLPEKRFIFEGSIHHRANELAVDYSEHQLIMIGSWQTIEHFQQVGKSFCQFIKPQFKLSADYHNFSTAIRSSELPVFVHVRRGDFISLGHGVHTPSYYRAAAEAIQGRLLAEPDWFVFSEDQDWCRSNLAFLGERVRFVSVKSAHSEIEELLLMKECRGGAIIANSSFSWWGAALGDDPCRPVIASRYRHGIGERNVQAQRLLPHWQMVEEF